MDSIDKKILKKLLENARTPVNEIAKSISLTSPAVSERIKKMEKGGVIDGYTVRLSKSNTEKISAFISMSVTPAERKNFISVVQNQHEVEYCYNVTGDHSYIILVNCADMSTLEKLIGRFQRFGQTSTQIILSTPVARIEYDYETI